MISIAHANQLLDHLLGNATYTAGTLWLALYATANGDAPLTEADLVGAELTVAGYARQSLTFGAAQDAEEGRASVSLSASGVTYTASSGSQAPAAWAICTAASGGAVLWYGEIGDFGALVDTGGYTIPAKSLAVAINAGGVTAYTAKKLLDLSLGVATYTQPALQLAILDTSGTELAEPGYARRVPGFVTASSGIARASALNYNVATTAWDCKFLSLSDGTNELARIDISVGLVAGEYLSITTGDVTVGLT